MERKLLFCAFLTLIAAGVLWACRKEWRPDSDAAKDALTVEQARAFFENSTALTKAGGYLSSARGAGGDLNPGDVTPRWERAHRATLNNYVDGVDVEIDPTYGYSAVFPEVTSGGDTVRHTVEVAQKLVVNRWRNHPRWLGLYAYIATIIPTPRYYAMHKDLGRTFVNLGDKRGFSGFVIYHTLSGEFVNADRYDDGKLTSQVYDTGSDAADRYAAAQMLGDVELYGNVPSMYALNLEAPEVTVTACRACKMQGCKCKQNGALPCKCLGTDPPTPPQDTTQNKPKPPVGGGTNPDDDDKDKKPPIVTKKNDCNQNYSKNLSSAKNILNMAPNANGWKGALNQWSKFLKDSDGKEVEYGLSMYRITQSSEYVYNLTETSTGTANDVPINMAKESSLGTHTVATFHTHTNGLPPSGMDVAELCNIERNQLDDVYVITGSGSSRTVYTLHVENRDAMVSCRRSIQVDPNTNHFTAGSEAGHHYNEAMARFEGSQYSEEDKHAYCLAYALEKCNTGIRLLRGSLTPNGTNVAFEQIQMELQTNATNLKNCK
ncbi:MAG: hypothetical protein LIO68_04260 [Rikenellaceae bacterium]|nr:hypothetical protein [Rikenellaceae bacterium]